MAWPTEGRQREAVRGLHDPDRAGMRTVGVSGTLLRVHNLTKRLGARLVLRGIDFRVHAGEVVSLVGPNGAGKTTLLRILGLLSAGDAGYVAWFDGSGDMPSIRRQVGYVGHETYLYEHLTARENLAYYAGLARVPAARRRVEEVLERFGLAHVAQAPVRTFSRGMRQRLTLGRALLSEPRLLLLDEPRTGLDRGGREVLDRVIAEVRSAGGAVVMSDHEVADAVGRSNFVLMLDRGQQIHWGPGGADNVGEILSRFPGEDRVRPATTRGAAGDSRTGRAGDEK